MDSIDDKKMEDELRELAARACRQIMRSLEQEPSVILEGDEAGDLPDSVIEEIEAWMFKKRQEDDNANDSLNH